MGAQNKTPPVDRRRSGRGGGVARGTDVGGQPANGAPRTVRPTVCGKSFRIVITLSVIQRKGRRGRRPLRWLRDSGFSGAVRYAGSLGTDSSPVTMYAASPVSLPPVRGGVLDAPCLRDCRGGLDAPVRLDQWHPRLIRRARLLSTTQRIISRGRSPRTICGRGATTPVASHHATFASLSPVRGGVLDAPRLRDCRANLYAPIQRDQLHLLQPRCAR